MQSIWILVPGILLAAVHLAFGQFPGGGSEGDPYLIADRIIKTVRISHPQALESIG
jgi:hypothetical protein